MTPESLEVLDNAIKILGPATITGLVGYYSARIQLTVRLKELDKGNEFKAREHFFKHYKEKQSAVGTRARQLLSSLLTKSVENDRDELLLLRQMVLEAAQIGMQNMQQRKLDDKYKLQFENLVRAHQIVSAERLVATDDDRKHLIDLARQLDLCGDLIAEENIQWCFGKYFS
jgi:hypothetical protein